jgi:hypothetical protein
VRGRGDNVDRGGDAGERWQRMSGDGDVLMAESYEMRR